MSVWCVPTHLPGAMMGSVTDAVRAWAALLRTHATLVPALDREVRTATGLPLAWYDVLLELYESPGRRLRMSELGARVVLSRTRVSRVVDDLVAAELVARETNPDDGRSAFAVLTPTGRARFRKAAPVYLAAIEHHIGAGLTPAENAQLARLLEKLLASEGGNG